MDQVIYGDILFLINFSMDFLTLYVVSSLLKIKFSRLGIIIAATIGATYSVFEVMVHKDSIILTVACAVVMCIATFGKGKLSMLISELLSFITANFILGGGMTCIFEIFNSFGNRYDILIYGQMNSVGKQLPLPIFILAFSILSVIVIVFSRLYSGNRAISEVEVIITYNGKTVKYEMLADSGNLLIEPLSGDPVIFLGQEQMEKLCGANAVKGILSADTNFMRSDTRNIRLIVYETVSGKEIGVCIRPQRILIGGNSVSAWITVGKTETGRKEGIVPASLVK